MMTNRFKSLSQTRAGTEKTPRDEMRELQDYETPENVTLALCAFVGLGPTPKILEPAAGSGRMVRALQRGYSDADITATDIKPDGPWGPGNGQDFLQRDDTPFPGHIITNPPYGKLGDAFIRKALTIADGKVCMLMGSTILFGSKRERELWHPFRPERIILIPWRVMFIDGGTGEPIKSQTLTNAWIAWPERERRERNKRTRVTWANDDCTEIALMVA
jgi:hypothetical protein